MFNLDGKTAIITGGSRGIGKAISLKLAEHGANIILTYLGNKDNALTVRDKIRSMGKKSEAFQCDAADFEETKKLVNNSISEFSTIDILVNNAGITGKSALAFALTSSEFDNVINTNLKGTFNMCHHLYPIFVKKHYGKIINIASIAGLTALAGQSVYSASKAGVIGFTKALAKELASRNISCNAIAPGFINSDMTSDIKASVEKTIPMKRLGSTEDIANLALFLASPCSDYITGEIIKVDGGLCI